MTEIGPGRTIFGRIFSINREYLDFEDQESYLSLINALVWIRLSPSKAQARNSIKIGAIRINGLQEKDINRKLFSSDFLNKEVVVLENGKYNFGLIHDFYEWELIK